MKLKKNMLLMGTVVLVAATIFYACQKDVKQGALSSSNSSDGKAATLDPLKLSCTAVSGASIDITVCAGASGARAGFSIQWETLTDYQNGPDGIPGTKDDNSWSSSAPSYRCASWSGVPGCVGSNRYSLGANECATVNVGNNLFDDCGASAECGPTTLNCGTTYIFRAFAHNIPGGLKASNKSGTTQCTTFDCGGEGCTYTQGYWKTHNPVVCETDATSPLCIQWPVTDLTLGTVSYDVSQLLSILNTPAQGNGLLTLAHQLIAAKLNIANGSDGSAIAADIATADALIGSLVIPPVGSGSLSTASTSSLVTSLTNFNEGATGPGHCSE